MKKCKKSFLLFVGILMLSFDKICDSIIKNAPSTEEEREQI